MFDIFGHIAIEGGSVDCVVCGSPKQDIAIVASSGQKLAYFELEEVQDV